MNFTGIPTSLALTLFAALAAIIILLYFIKTRKKPVSVPFMGLWLNLLKTKKTYQSLLLLKKILSILLWITILALILLALLDPRPKEDSYEERNFLFLFDTSASMATIEEEHLSRLDIAKEKALKQLEDLTPADRVMIIAASASINNFPAEFSNDKNKLKNFIEKLQPTATEFDPQESLKYAVDILKNRQNPHLEFFSDAAFHKQTFDPKIIPPNFNAIHHLNAKNTENLSILAFNIRQYPLNKQEYEVFIKIKNDFNTPQTLNLQFHNLIPKDDNPNDFTFKPIASEKLTLQPHQTLTHFYKNLPTASNFIAATIQPENPNTTDPLPLDNTAYAFIPQYDKIKILAISKDNLFLQAALLLNENIELTLLSPSDPSITNPQTQNLDPEKIKNLYHDIVIFDNSLDLTPPITINPKFAGNFIFINPKGSDSPFTSHTKNNPIIERISTKNPVSKYLSLATLNITQSQIFRLQKNDSLVAQAIHGPIIITRQTENQKFLAIGFSLLESDIVFRVAMPIMLLNAVDWFMNQSSDPLEAYKTGLPAHIPIPNNITHINITDPNNNTLDNIPNAFGTVSFIPELSGFYTLQDTNDPDQSWKIVANLQSPLESNIAPAQNPLFEIKTQKEEKSLSIPESSTLQNFLLKLPLQFSLLWVLATLLAILLITLEWLTFHRRWTL